MSSTRYSSQFAYIESMEKTPSGGYYRIGLCAVMEDGSTEEFAGLAHESRIANVILTSYRVYGSYAVFKIPVLVDAEVAPQLGYAITAVRATDDTYRHLEAVVSSPLPSNGGRVERGVLVNMIDADVALSNPLRFDVYLLNLPTIVKLFKATAKKGDYIAVIEAAGSQRPYLVSEVEVDEAVMQLYRASHSVFEERRLWKVRPEVEYIVVDQYRIAALRRASEEETPGAMPDASRVPDLPTVDGVPAKAERMELLEVVDGDTLRTRRPATGETLRIRFLGIDAYQPPSEGGLEAAAFLRQALAECKEVYFLEDPANSPDPYGRLVGEVYALVGGKYINIGPLMLSRGYAELYGRGLRWTSDIADYDEYKRWYESYRGASDERKAIAETPKVCEPRLTLSRGIDDRDRVLGPLPPSGLRIGDCQFVIPPTSIKVSRRAKNASVPLLRSKSAIKRSSGHTDVVIEVTLWFNSPEEINGFRVPATDISGNPIYDGEGEQRRQRYYYVNGLRPLIAQFKRTPFLPVENELLNTVHNVYAVTLSSLVVETVPGAPGTLVAHLTMLKFNHDAYMPDADTLAERIVWPLFREYYQRALADHNDMPPVLGADGKLRLWSVPDEGFNDKMFFLVPDEESASNIMWSSLTLSQMEWVDAGYEPTSSFGKKYADAKLMKQAVEQREKWDECGHDTWKYWDTVAQKPGMLESLGDMLGAIATVPGTTSKYVEERYGCLLFWPAKLYDSSTLVNKDLPVSCDVFVLKLSAQENQRLDGVYRLYRKNGMPSDYYAIPAYREDVVRKILSFEPKAFKEQVQQQVDSGEETLSFYERTIDDLIPTSVMVAYNNTITSLQVAGQESPVHQYLGSQETYIRMTFETTSREAVTELRALHEYSQRLSRTYRVGIESGFIRLKSRLTRLLGIDAVVIESCEVTTEPGYFHVELVMSSFDRTQRDTERLEFLTRTSSQGALEQRDTPLALRHREYLRLENRWRVLETYPDLELPTYLEVNEELAKLGIKGSLKPPREGAGFVDPDFYVVYPDTFKRQVYELISDEFEVEITDGAGGRETIDQKRFADLVEYLTPSKSTFGEATEVMSGGGTLVEVTTDQTPDIVGPSVAESEKLKSDLKWKTGFCYVLPYTAHESSGKSSLTSAGKAHKSYHTAKCSSLPVGTVVWIKSLAHLPNGGYFVIEDDGSEDEEYKNAKANSGVHRIGIFYSEYGGDVFPAVKEPGWFATFTRWLRDVFGSGAPSKTKAQVGGKTVTVPVVEFAIVGTIDLDSNAGHTECRKWLERLFGRTETGSQTSQDVLAPQPDYGDPRNALSGMLFDMFQYDCRGRLVRAFPSYQLFFVDEGRWVSYWRLFDNFYGLNAVSSIDLYNSRKSAASTCVIELSNVYGNITSFDFDDEDESEQQDPSWVKLLFGGFSPNDPEVQELLREREMGKRQLFMRPGARLHLRMGYGGNAGDLPIVFNGTITEMQPGDVVRIIAQGDGIELTGPVKTTTIQRFEPRNRIGELLTGDMTPFQEFLYGLTKGNISGPNYHIVHFGDIDFKDGTLYYSVRELVQNVYPGHGICSMTELPQTVSEWIDEALHLLSLESLRDEINIGLNMSGKTVWDVVQTCAGCVPDYVAAVVPFQLRSTLFYGRPFWPYTYRYDERGVALRKPFWQFHVYHSMTDILSNGIVATEDGVFTNVHLRFNTRGKDGVVGQSVTVYADTDINPEKQKTMVVASDLEVGTPFLGKIPLLGRAINYHIAYPVAYNYAQSILVDSLKDMYKGELLVLGDPTVKPHDPVYIFDEYTQMYGLVQVKEVVHHFSQETGFVTGIVPDCCVAGLDCTMSTSWSILSGVGSAAGAVATFSYFARKSVQAALADQVIQRAAKTGGMAAVQGLLQAVRADAARAYAAVARYLGNLKTVQFVTGRTATVAAAADGARSTIGRMAASTVAKSLVRQGVMLALYVVAKSVGDYIKRKAYYRQCVIIAPLRLAGREFSAGINGSKGAVVGSVAGSIDKWMQKAFGWMGVSYEHRGVPILDTQELVVPDASSQIAGLISSSSAAGGRWYSVSEAGASTKKPRSRAEINCSAQEIDELTRLVWGEAAGEPMLGKIAVAAVVLNRVLAPGFPSTVHGVIFAQTGRTKKLSSGKVVPLHQFSCLDVDDTGSSRFEQASPSDAAWDECAEAVRRALAGEDPSGGALFFYNPQTATNSWIFANTREICTIGRHRFAGPLANAGKKLG